VETGQASLCDIVVHPIGMRYNSVTSQPIQSMRPLGDSLLSAAGLRWKCSDQKAAPPYQASATGFQPEGGDVGSGMMRRSRSLGMVIGP
jgi:hypothetical protein